MSLGTTGGCEDSASEESEPLLSVLVSALVSELVFELVSASDSVPAPLSCGGRLELSVSEPAFGSEAGPSLTDGRVEENDVSDDTEGSPSDPQARIAVRVRRNVRISAMTFFIFYSSQRYLPPIVRMVSTY